MATEEINKTLNKLQKSEFPRLREDFQLLNGIELPDKGTKAEIVSHLSSKLKRANKLQRQKLALLVTSYVSKRMTWEVYQIGEVEDTLEPRFGNAREFQTLLERELIAYFPVDICVMTIEEAYWISVVVNETRRNKSDGSTPAYFVYYPQSHFLVASQLRAANARFIIQGFLNVMDCCEAMLMNLKGHCVSSLAQLASNEYAKKHSEQPLKIFKGKKRPPPDEDLDCQIIPNDAELAKNEALDRKFGNEIQPILEKVDYKIETQFKGVAHAPMMASRQELFQCRVTFHGKNIIEGIRELGKTGLAEMPMPKHMGSLSTLGRSTVVLRDRKDRTLSQGTESQQ